jgi:hypothetical protein
LPPPNASHPCLARKKRAQTRTRFRFLKLQIATRAPYDIWKQKRASKREREHVRHASQSVANRENFFNGHHFVPIRYHVSKEYEEEEREIGGDQPVIEAMVIVAMMMLLLFDAHHPSLLLFLSLSLSREE